MDDFESLVFRIEQLQMVAKTNFPGIKRQVNAVIENQITSVNRIERLLDSLLDYAQLCIGEEEFKRLNKYYGGINPENSEFYTNEYQAMVDE